MNMLPAWMTESATLTLATPWWQVDVTSSVISWALFFIWTLYSAPLWYKRHVYRCTVYGVHAWWVSFVPWFWQDIKTLFYNNKPADPLFTRIVEGYRRYLLVWILLGVLWYVSLSW